MIFVRLLPVVLSMLLLAAHFLKNGQLPFVLLNLGMLWVLSRRARWVPQVVQLFLLFAALEWVRALFALIAARRAAGEPWIRLAFILGGVAGFTLASALVFGQQAVRARYAGGGSGGSAPGEAVPPEGVAPPGQGAREP